MKYSILALLVLSACGGVAVPRGNTARSGGVDTCNAAAFQYLVGQDAVNALVVPDPKRSYRPDEAVTMDHMPDRVNIQLDNTDTIVAVTCG